MTLKEVDFVFIIKSILSETFLNSSIEINNDRISIDGYILIKADHPSDSKRGGFCIYYKEHIPLIKRGDICTLDNCLVTEIRSQGGKCFLFCIYRSQVRTMIILTISVQNLIYF